MKPIKNIEAVKLVEQDLAKVSEKRDFFEKMPRYIVQVGRSVSGKHGLKKPTKATAFLLAFRFKRRGYSFGPINRDRFGKFSKPVWLRLISMTYVTMHSGDPAPGSDIGTQGVDDIYDGADPCKQALLDLGAVVEFLNQKWDAYESCLDEAYPTSPQEAADQLLGQTQDPSGIPDLPESLDIPCEAELDAVIEASGQVDRAVAKARSIPNCLE